MANKKLTSAELHKSVLGDGKNGISGNENTSGNSGSRKKVKPTGTTVKSRYMQTTGKKPQPKPATPQKTSQNTVLQETLNCDGVLQSTILLGHALRPDFDMSAIVGKPLSPGPRNTETVEPKHSKDIIELQTFLLTYTTAKMEHNTHIMKKEAEKELLAMMEVERELQVTVHEKKRQYHLREKQKQLNNLLDAQIAALTPVAAVTSQFTQNYQMLATAVDATRHELPVKNLHLEDNREQFLEEAVSCLKRSEELLLQHTKGVDQGSESAWENLSRIKDSAQDLNQQLVRGGSDLQELSSLVSQLTVESLLEKENLLLP
ncbi:HAUS augmin-like complex subunit 8 [Clupea harengus]|uniref:HAUS augmin-like complex subunit 8 n=1 Tax=Clupea harengus TaxID=7950 RepID=A0A6P3WCW4_CLUHA|nr:HAUS augmin-like complex subunit 8 [Clupea harengus]